MIQSSQKIAVLGAGQIGAVIAGMLAEQGHKVTLADASETQLGSSAGQSFATKVVDAGDLHAVGGFLKNQDIVVSACPYFLNQDIARVAVETGTHYFDLTEDVATTGYIKEISAAADVILAPQCGLAPGFICVLGADMAARFDTVKAIRMRVGALPVYPTNVLRTTSPGRSTPHQRILQPLRDRLSMASDRVPALEGVESVDRRCRLRGVQYVRRARHVDGTLAGKVRDRSYRRCAIPAMPRS